MGALPARFWFLFQLFCSATRALGQPTLLLGLKLPGDPSDQELLVVGPAVFAEDLAVPRSKLSDRHCLESGQLQFDVERHRGPWLPRSPYRVKYQPSLTETSPDRAVGFQVSP